MKRRDFIQIAGVLPFIYSCSDKDVGHFDIEVLSNHEIGHLLKEAIKQTPKELTKGNIGIVGGGVAGLSAAYQLRNEAFTLFELNDYIGGTSASVSRLDTNIALGAHYDLAYPSNYGKEALQVLQDLNIIYWNPKKEWWSFVDQQFVIPNTKTSRIFQNGKYRSDFFTDPIWYEKFKKLVVRYEGKFAMPLMEFDKALDQLSFAQFLRNEIGLSSEIEQLLDYHMKDDFGASAAEVSAIAGLSYYACRPYYTNGEELFSPPEGNAYFSHKLSNGIDTDKIRRNSLVYSIKRKERTFVIKWLDTKEKQTYAQEFNQVIYAGKQHTLKYVFPEIVPSLKPMDYAPWCLVSLIMNDFSIEPYWQNELIGMDEDLLGFVDSGAQYQTEGKRFLNVYYCLKENEREKLIQWANDPEVLVQKTIRYINTYFGENIRDKILKVIVHPIGHGMPIAKSGYLGYDANDHIPFRNFAVAGVDNGRLPLFFEALDSGIQAVKRLKNED